MDDCDKLHPHDRRELEQFVDFIREAGEIGRAGNPDGLTWGDLYDEMYADDPPPPPSGRSE